MKKYWEILRKYRLSIILCPVLVLITVFCETIQPLFMSRIVDQGIMNSDLSYVLRTGGVMVGISVLGLAVSILNVYISSKTSISFGSDLRFSLFRKIQQLAFPDLDRFSTGSLITRLTNDITKVQQVVLVGLRVMLRAPLMLVMAMFFIITIKARLALILAAAIPLLAVSIWIILKKGFPFFIRVQERVDSLNNVVRENLINIRVVKSFVREDYETRKFENKNLQLRDTVIKASNTIVNIFPVMQLTLNMSLIVILWFGGRRVISGDLMVGELISLVNYVMQVLMSLMMFSMVVMTIARASASSDRIVEVLDTEPSLADTVGSEKAHNSVMNGDVEFRNVCFRYPDGVTDVLRNIDFSIRQGEMFAIVGATGSAKTSLVQLIPRLYDVTQGAVLVSGRDVRDYTLEELHDGVGMVLQKNVLFSGTILENLRWGNEYATIEEVREAAAVADADSFIMSFPEGYDIVLGRGGVNVSGGQKQRICIARALLKKPRILILDDSTSAVDTETEQRIRKNLGKYLSATTVIIITQRVNTMQAADRVLILDDGEIVGLGTPEYLMENSEFYREIYNSQQVIE